jgi:hypothetical protein
MPFAMASTSPRSQNAIGDFLSVIRVIVAPFPVDGLLTGIQLNERTPLMLLGLVSLVRAVFVVVPGVVVLVGPVVVAFVVLALPVFVFSVVVLLASSGHHRNRRSQGGSQKERTEISVSTVHVFSL